VIRRCYEAMWIKKDSKERSKMTQHRQSTRTRKSAKRSVREASKTRPARGHHRLTVGPTTARGGACMAVCPGWHGRASPLPPICGFSSQLFGFLCNFFLFWLLLCLLKGMYLDLIPPHSIHHSPSSLV